MEFLEQKNDQEMNLKEIIDAREIKERRKRKTKAQIVQEKREKDEENKRKKEMCMQSARSR